jgi:hypothetical protein
MAKSPKNATSKSVPIGKKKKPIVFEFVLGPEEPTATPPSSAIPAVPAAKTGSARRKKRVTFRF